MKRIIDKIFDSSSFIAALSLLLLLSDSKVVIPYKLPLEIIFTVSLTAFVLLFCQRVYKKNKSKRDAGKGGKTC